MEWKFLVALVLAIPIFSLPMFLWYLDIGGRFGAILEERGEIAGWVERRVTRTSESAEANKNSR